ncbi:uncharacterized protein LOC110807465, partial [Carica papaya]|uniref:uncharacterized protein LOC110807465 n=1 Tax=Carica papaya TaxID=3649 RepID=UPI000B8CF51F
MKGLLRFGKKGKLSPRFIGPFEILEKVGVVAYRVALPPRYSGVHNVFHVSLLRKYRPDPNHILRYESLPLEKDLSYEEEPIQVLERQERKLRSRVIPMVKIQWRHHAKEEATWEREDEMRRNYPELFGGK